jgi:hypothetical protein
MKRFGYAVLGVVFAALGVMGWCVSEKVHKPTHDVLLAGVLFIGGMGCMLIAGAIIDDYVLTNKPAAGQEVQDG